MTASAVDADFAQVTLRGDTPGLAGKLVQAVEGKPATMSFTESRGRNRSASWQRIGIPVQIEGRCRRAGNDTPTPDYLDGLTVTVHVLFKTKNQSGGDSYARVSKTLTYHEIALSRGSGANSNSKVEMTVDLFLSPRNAMKISTAGPKAKSTAVKVIAIALEGSFGGQTCQRLEQTEPDVRFDRTDLPKSWWTSDKVNDCGAVLYALNEPPYAAFASATDAWVTTDGATAPSAPAVPAGDDTTTLTPDSTTGSTGSDAGVTPTTDDTTATADEEETGSRKGKKGSKKTKRSRR